MAAGCWLLLLLQTRGGGVAKFPCCCGGSAVRRAAGERRPCGSAIAPVACADHLYPLLSSLTGEVVGRLKADAARRARHERDLALEVGRHGCEWCCCCRLLPALLSSGRSSLRALYGRCCCCCLLHVGARGLARMGSSCGGERAYAIVIGRAGLKLCIAARWSDQAMNHEGRERRGSLLLLLQLFQSSAPNSRQLSASAPRLCKALAFYRLHLFL